MKNQTPPEFGDPQATAPPGAGDFWLLVIEHAKSPEAQGKWFKLLNPPYKERYLRQIINYLRNRTGDVKSVPIAFRGIEATGLSAIWRQNGIWFRWAPLEYADGPNGEQIWPPR